MELHYYPGEKLLLAISRNQANKVTIHGKFEAWGGPSTLGNDPRMPEEPTWPGEYIIDKARVYHTPSWKLSAIKWGTPLRDKPAEDDVWYQIRPKLWASVKADHAIARKDIIKLHYDLYQVRTIPATWIFNDFGPVVIMWFKDLNDNKRLDGKESPSGQMFHSTPENEAQVFRDLSIKFSLSHGCIHLKPSDRNTLFARGFFNPGTPFVIYGYFEKFHEKFH